MNEKTRFHHNTQLGQNFLVNRSIIAASIEKAALKSCDVVLEIGAGQGVLTQELLASPCAGVHAMEIDRRLEPWLLPLGSHEKLQLHWGDALQTELSALTPRPNKLVANIPYHITTPLIWKMLEELTPLGLSEMVLLVQKESADRLSASSRCKERYPLGVTLQAMGSVHSFMKVSPGSFSPPPKVWSALVHIQIGQRQTLAQDSLWRRLLRSAFSQRRKMMVKSCSSEIDKSLLAPAMEHCAISLQSRAEELTTDQWIALHERLKEQLL